MFNRLQSGEFTGPEGSPNPGRVLKRKAVFCYEGEFQSMDGPVTVTKEKLERVAQWHNTRVVQSRSQNGGVAQAKHCPPLQLDHSTSARETVGRVMDPVSVERVKLLDGSTPWGLVGEVSIIDSCNTDKVDSGIWTNLSIGANFETGEFQELTITPFPAAPEASFLSKKNGTPPRNYRWEYNYKGIGAHLMPTATGKEVIVAVEVKGETLYVGRINNDGNESAIKKKAEDMVKSFVNAGKAKMSGKSRLSKEVRYKNGTIYVMRYSNGDYEAYVHSSYIRSEPTFVGRNEAEVVKQAKKAIDEHLKRSNKTEFSKALLSGEKMAGSKIKKTYTIRGQKFLVEGERYALTIYHNGKEIGMADDLSEAEDKISYYMKKKNLSSGETMNEKQKALENLKKRKKMSAEEAEEKLAKMSDDEIKSMAEDYDKMQEGETKDEKLSRRLKEAQDKAMSYFSSEAKKIKEELSAEEDEDADKMSDGDDDGDKLSNAEDSVDHLSDDEDEDADKLSNAEDSEDKLSDEDKDGDKLSNAEDSVDHLSEEEKLTKLQDKYMKMLTDQDMSEEKALKKVRKMSTEEVQEAIEEHEKKYHMNEDEDKDGDKLSDGEDEDKDKLSSEDKDGDKMSADDEDDKALSEDKLEEDEDPSKRLSRMSAAATRVESRLSGATKLLNRAKVQARLSALKATAKMTPAEIKKIDVDEVAAMREEDREKMFKLMEAREPVLFVGMLGTTKGVSLSKLNEQIKRLKEQELEDEMLEFAPSTARMKKGTQAASGKSDEKKTDEKVALSALDPKNLDHVLKAIENSLDQGKIEEAKRLSRGHFDSVAQLAQMEQDEIMSSANTIKELESLVSDLAKEFRLMRKQF